MLKNEIIEAMNSRRYRPTVAEEFVSYFSNYEKEDGSKVFKLDVVAEKVTFLSSKSKDTPERD